MPARGDFKVAVSLARREKIQNNFHSDQGGTRLRVGARKPCRAMQAIARAARSEGKPLGAVEQFDGAVTPHAIRARNVAFQAEAIRPGLPDGVIPGRESGILVELQFLVIVESFIGGKKQKTKGVSGPAIV